MKLNHKRVLSAIMIAGDIMMAFIALALIFEEDLAFFGICMLGFLAIDIYLTFDYIKALRHRIKVEESLKADNAHAAEIRARFEEMSRQERANQPRQTTSRRRAPASAPAPGPAPVQAPTPVPTPVPQPVNEDDEDDLAELLKGPSLPGNQNLHG